MAAVLARTPDGLELAAVGSNRDQDQRYGSTAILPTKDGKRLVCVQPTEVHFVNVSTQEKELCIPEAGVVLAALSATGAFLVTCQRPGKGEDGKGAQNLKVWDSSSGKCLLSLSQRAVSKDNWPVLHWADDDSFLAQMVTNTVHLYSRSNDFSAYTKVAIKGIGGMALSPSPSSGARPLLAAFVPEIKGSPAGAGIYSLDQPEPTPSVRKSFFRTQGARLMWNATASACLVLSFADYDATNQSYYGEQKLHYLPAPGSKAEACQVPLPKEGPVHDVQWSPSGDFFITIAGFMPARVTLFNDKCVGVYDLGSGPYSMVRWNPFDRFFIIAGFGNLPGDIVFYDKKTSGTCKQMGAVRAPAVAAEWSPDGRMLMTATTAPRLRVDNNIKVFTYFGEQKMHKAYPTLLEAAWMPAAPGTFEDRPQSPERIAASSKSQTLPSETLAGPSYVPPHVKKGGGSSAAPKFSLARDKDDQPGKIKAGFGPGVLGPARPQRLPPGAEFVAPSAGTSKTAKRRAKKKAAGGGAEGEGDEPDSEEAAVAEATAGMAAASVQEAPAPADDEEARQKRIRALQKKHRQIVQLKEKLAQQGEGALQAEQLEKVRAEQQVLDELASLGAQP